MEHSEQIKKTGKKSKYSFLVLMDFSNASYTALKYSISLAKLLNANIHVMHVVDVSSLVKGDNQASAMRAVDSKVRGVENKLRSIVEIIETEDVSASQQHLMGNITLEAGQYAKEFKPDLIVVGKKSSKLNFSGRLSNYLTNKYSGAVLIVDEDAEFRADMNITFGYNGKPMNDCDPQLLFEMDKHSNRPLTCLKVDMQEGAEDGVDLPESWISGEQSPKDINYESRVNSTMADGLVDYISNHDVELLCIGREKQKSLLKGLLSSQRSNTARIINRVHIPIMLMRREPATAS